MKITTSYDPATWQLSLKDGRTYPGRTATEALSAMREGSPFTEDMSLRDYKKFVAQRVWRLRGRPLDWKQGDPEFLRELAATGLVNLTVGDAS